MNFEIGANFLQAHQTQSEQANLRIERELSEGLDTGAGGRPAPSDNQSITQGEAAALDVDDAPWKKNHPHAQPLTYAIPTHLNGSKEYRRIKFEVDFSDADSVEKANKIRRQGLYRAGQRLNLPLKRPSTQGRQFTQVNNNWIIAKYNDYARDNNGARITMAKLHEEYEKQFPAEGRTQSSLATHIDRVDYLRAHKYRFPPK